MTTEQAKIVEELGFEICEFGPDSDPCEECKESNLQLYFQGSAGEGRYLCLDCILVEHADNQKAYADIVQLEKEGHTYHCACRRIWGDGECECKPCAACGEFRPCNCAAIESI